MSAADAPFTLVLEGFQPPEARKLGRRPGPFPENARKPVMWDNMPREPPKGWNRGTPKNGPKRQAKNFQCRHVLCFWGPRAPETTGFIVFSALCQK